MSKVLSKPPQRLMFSLKRAQLGLRDLGITSDL